MYSNPPVWRYYLSSVLLVLIWFCGDLPCTHAFMPSKALQPHHPQQHSTRSRSIMITMRDASMIVDFEKGDMVKVKPDIILDGINWGGMVGKVTDTWVKCEVDPHCCCAELATEGPIRVDFAASDATSNKATYQYFGENEIEKVQMGRSS